MSKRLILPGIIFFLLFFFVFVWFKEGLLPVDKKDKKPVIFVIRKGETINQIANNLENGKLIRNKLVFFILVKKLGIEKAIQAGDYRLYRSYTAEKIALSLTHGTLDIWVTIIEGYRKEEIAQILAKSNSIPESVFSSRANEGYIFPDTYLIPSSSDITQILAIIEHNFKLKLSPEIIAKAKQKGFDLNELLIIASLIEREAKQPEARRVVAGIILNRLAEEMPLQIDATVQYALGYDEKNQTWWKKNLTVKDLQFDSPYNTYLNVGLPPGPICNPSLDSILSVIEAKKTNYFYYISDKTGVMHYARTLDEHNKNIQKYLQ